MSSDSVKVPHETFLEDKLRQMFMRIANFTADQYQDRSVYEDVDYMQFGVTFVASIVIILAAWMIFEYMARHPSARCLTRQRLFHPQCLHATKIGDDHRDPPPDVKSWNSYLFGAFTIPDEELPGLMGPGGHLTYRLMQYCVYFAHVSLIYALIVLIPLYLSQFYHAHRVEVDILNMMSISFISPTNPSHMWVVVISSYLLVAYWLFAIYAEWQHVKAVRLSWEHDSRSYNLQSHYSLMVERSDSSRRLSELRSYFSKLLGKDESEIPIVMPVLPSPVLNNLRSRRFWLRFAPNFCVGGRKDQLTRNYTAQIEIERERLKHAIVCAGDTSRGSSQVVRVPNRRSLSVTRSISMATFSAGEDGEGFAGTVSQTTVKTAFSMGGFLKRLFEATHSPVYFVSLRSMRSRTVLAHMNKAQGDSFARITTAPPPRDLIWDNVTVDHSVITTRRFLVRTVLLVFGITYAIPLNWLLDIGRKHRRENFNSGETKESPAVISGDWLKDIFFLFFPAIVQIMISQLVPRILRLVSHRYEKFKTYQQVTLHVMQRTYLFQLLTIYIIVFGDMWFDVRRLQNGLTAFWTSVLERFRRLGRATPPVALYFSTSVIITLVTEIAHPLVKPVDLVIVLWDRFVNGNKNAWKECDMLQLRYTGSMISHLTLLNTMFTFSVIAPIVVFFCWIFWCLCYVWTVFALIYQNNRRYEVGTSYSPALYSAITYSLIFSQMSVYLVIWSYSKSTFDHHAHPQLYTIGALVLICIIFKFIVMRDFRLKANEFTSLEISAEMDQLHKPEEMPAMFNPEYYLQPSAKPNPGRLSGIIETSVEETEESSNTTPSDSESAALINHNNIT